MHGWTQERREKQAQAIRHWRPWDRSTGPRNDQGKTRSARNAYKGGERQRIRELSKAINDLLRELAGFDQP